MTGGGKEGRKEGSMGKFRHGRSQQYINILPNTEVCIRWSMALFKKRGNQRWLHHRPVIYLCLLESSMTLWVNLNI